MGTDGPFPQGHLGRAMAWDQPGFEELYSDIKVDEGICYGLMHPPKSFNYTSTRMICIGYPYVSPPPLRRVRFSDVRPLAILNCRGVWCDHYGDKGFSPSVRKNLKKMNSYTCKPHAVSFVLYTIQFSSSQKRQDGDDGGI